ncbi:MAG: hypothetical protein EXR62_06155 [Chloroflexi bacterium]|nr:hypothetical protein [Chloroflexota bacterium]
MGLFERIGKGLVLILLGVTLASLVLLNRSTRAGAAVQGEIQVESAAVSAPLLHYQGRLLDPATGNPKPDGSYTMLFGLYGVASGGAVLWTETQSVAVNNGLFSVLLGGTTALNQTHFDGRSLWLGVTVGSDPEATPRQRLAYVAYALRANDAGTLGGLQASDFAFANHTHSGSDITSGIVAEARIDPAIARDSEIMPTVLSRDGAGSGLDADLLDGRDSSSFAAASHVHSAADITSGVLHTDRFSAYVDLTAESKIGTAANQVAPGYAVPLLKFNTWSESLSVNTTRQYFTTDKLTVRPPANGYILIMASTRYNCPGNIQTQASFGVYVTTSASPPTAATSFTYGITMGHAHPLDTSSNGGDFNPNVIMYPVAVTGGATYNIWLGVDGLNIGTGCGASDPRIIATFYLSGM